jgi:anti-sigma factor RsiW
MKHEVSDEQLNAFIDGELDAADRERLLAAVAATANWRSAPAPCAWSRSRFDTPMPNRRPRARVTIRRARGACWRASCC